MYSVLDKRRIHWRFSVLREENEKNRTKSRGMPDQKPKIRIKLRILKYSKILIFRTFVPSMRVLIMSH